MIQAILLIALGFLTASLIGVIVAPALWRRAYRLSRKRLEHALPITLPEIEAAQDQLKASYAVRIRRLETALSAAKQKAAIQLVDNSRLHMQIAALKDEMAEIDLQLAERRNAATVLEQTITKRFPELDREITSVKAQLQERAHAIQDLANKLSRRNEELEAAQRSASSYQEELARLQQALEKGGAGRGGRRLRRASQWGLDDYRAEYDRLNLELSKLRQQLTQLQDRDAQQASVIKEDLQKLAELILASAQPKAEAGKAEKPGPVLRLAGISQDRRERPLPWPEEPSRPRAKIGMSAPSAETAGKAEENSAAETLAADFGARRVKAGKESAGKASPEENAGPEGQPPAPQPITREAVEVKPIEGSDYSSKNAEGSDARSACVKAAAAPAIKVSSTESKTADVSLDAQAGEKPAAQAEERNGAQPGGSLLERLRSTPRETVE